MDEKLHLITLLDDDRVDLIAFAERQWEKRLHLLEFSSLLAASDGQPAMMMDRFRLDIRNLSLSLLIKQEKTGHWVRYCKAWINNEPRGHLPDPKSLLEVYRVLGFTGKPLDWNMRIEQGSERYYANAAQVIEPGTHVSVIQVTHNNPKEEEYGRTS